jgi:hypothetical protein
VPAGVANIVAPGDAEGHTTSNVHAQPAADDAGAPLAASAVVAPLGI